MVLTLVESNDHLLEECLQFGLFVCLLFSHVWSEVMHFGGKDTNIS